MMRKPSQIVHCISCDLSCQLFPDSAVRVQYCHNAAFSIWPDGNAFLKKGFIEKLLLDRHNHLSSGFIFVDFLSRIFDDLPIYNGLTVWQTVVCILS